MRTGTAVAVALLLAACGPGGGRSAAPRTGPRPLGEAVRPAPAGSASAPPVASGEAPGANAAEAIARALAEAARVRGLPPKGPVRGAELSREEMAERVRRSIEREIPASDLEGEAAVLTALGLVPVEFDYVGTVTRMFGAELAGFYEPEEKTLFLDRALRGPEREATLSHELVHALQDQYFDLASLMKYRPDDADRLGAVHALAEGDAMSAMLDQMLAPQGKHATDLSDEFLGVQVRASAALDTKIADAPGVLTRSLLAPYVDGMIFVNGLRRNGGWEAVDRAWREPPVSTEQLLHPDKFASHEPPRVVPAPEAPPGTAFTRVYTDVFGEESVRVALEEWLPRGAAVEAASGWDGDHAAIFRDGDTTLLSWHVVYDDEPSAARAEGALARGLAKQGAVHKTRADRCVERADRGPLILARRGRELAVVGGPLRRSGGRGQSAGTCTTVRPWVRAILSFK